MDKAPTPRNLLYMDILSMIDSIKLQMKCNQVDIARQLTDQLSALIDSYQNDDDTAKSIKWKYVYIKGKWITQSQFVEIEDIQQEEYDEEHDS